VTATVPDLAGITHLDHTPTCDVDHDGPCPEPAAWIVWVETAVSVYDQRFMCPVHKDAVVRHMAACPGCASWLTLRTERL
jgi:hypothetical protein